MPDLQNQPLITVGIPAYNRAEGVARAIRSVLAQDYRNVEIIVSDNASTDGTEETCRRLAETDQRVRYHRHAENRGPTENFRHVLRKSTGRYFMWLADDDWLEPGILGRYASFMESNPDFALVTGNIAYWKEGEEVYNENDFTFDHDDPSCRVAAFFRKVFVGGLFHSLMRGEFARAVPVQNLIGFDWFFVARMLMHGKGMNLNEPGYHKSCLGLSRCHVNFARIIGASRFAAYNPYLNSCYHIFREMLWADAPYRRLSGRRRVLLALRCSYFVIRRFYLKRLRNQPIGFGWESIQGIFCGLFARGYQRQDAPPAAPQNSSSSA